MKMDWRVQLKVPGIVVTDAKSLFDHLGKSGPLPTERQTLIDLLVARDRQENGAVRFHWLPNTRTIANVLNKATAVNNVYEKFRDQGLYRLVPTAHHVEEENNRLELSRGQCQRAKLKKKACMP